MIGEPPGKCFNVKGSGINKDLLKQILRQFVSISSSSFEEMFQQIDNHHQEKVTWGEFTTFLKKAGQTRDLANSAAVTKFGFARATQGG